MCCVNILSYLCFSTEVRSMRCSNMCPPTTPSSPRHPYPGSRSTLMGVGQTHAYTLQWVVLLLNYIIFKISLRPFGGGYKRHIEQKKQYFAKVNFFSLRMFYVSWDDWPQFTINLRKSTIYYFLCNNSYKLIWLIWHKINIYYIKKYPLYFKGAQAYHEQPMQSCTRLVSRPCWIVTGNHQRWSTPTPTL